MRVDELPVEVRYHAPSSRRLVTTVVVVVAAGVLGLGTLWYTNVADAYRGSCKFAGGPAPVDWGNVAGAATASTPEGAIAAFAAQPGATATGYPVPQDGWHEYRGRWVRDIADDQFLEISVAETRGGWVVTSAISCFRM